MNDINKDILNELYVDLNITKDIEEENITLYKYYVADIHAQND